MVPSVSVGDRIRLARSARRLSLSEVASDAGVSVATLSRIERDKQGLDFGLFLVLANILGSSPRDLIGDDPGEQADPLAVRISGLNHDERVQLWRDLAAERRKDHRQQRPRSRRLGEEIEELLAQLEFVRSEMESVRTNIRQR